MELDLGKLLAQAQAFSRDLEGRREALGRREVEGQSGAGLVGAVMNGRGELLRLRIDPKAFAQITAAPDGAPADSALLQDLIVAAVNAALAEVSLLQQRELQGLAGGPFGGALPAEFAGLAAGPPLPGGGAVNE